MIRDGCRPGLPGTGWRGQNWRPFTLAPCSGPWKPRRSSGANGISLCILQMGVGEWEGLLVSEIDEKYPGLYDVWRSHPTQIRLKGAERFEDTRTRAWQTFRQIARNHPGQTVLIVSHMMCISSIMLTAAGIPLDEVWEHPITNGALNIIRVGEGGEAAVTDWSKDDHIPERYRLKQPFGRLK